MEGKYEEEKSGEEKVYDVLLKEKKMK